MEVFTTAWRAILANPMRSILTALGVIIGVASVVALTGIGSGTTSSITRSLEGLGTNLLTISSDANSRTGLVQQSTRATLTRSDLRAIQTFSPQRIQGVAPTAQTSTQARRDGENLSVNVIGSSPDYETVRNSTPEQGSFFTMNDAQGRRKVAVIGFEVASTLFPSEDALGGTFRLNNQTFTVVGVLEDKGSSGFTSPNTQVIVPFETFETTLGREQNGNINSIYVQAANEKDLSDLQLDLTDLLDARHRIASEADRDFSIQNQADVLQSLSTITSTLTLFLGGVAGISLLVGGIGIMNIMLVSVTERTREIGIRKALGATPLGIRTQFLIEATLLSISGGVIGILVGLGLAYGVGALINTPPVPSVSSIGLAFLFSLGVGVFFGYYPASRASLLDPVESLRYE
ncbi:ABC transporter permease [Deinococcus cellulosilyticus]|uniref:ABC transporter permease n=1 Tax=Deinococcus cellulosilyticus (strain DSM 18568 / NBRC 106333 / KACC 11606 / 5516J-15) TaxID=1223518 RepID=A0A511MYK0_DEIC1|nr:ABC transporter permease [Deinococcus cellulosilyticus]GEM45674.1 ABC transporter permease [Deinococcus cellulosilyticus NBRC 106333 = KACC 11606]